MTPKEFQRRMRTLAKNIEVNAPKAVQRAALAVDQTLVTSTPVDTGRARSNWQVSTSGPASGEREAFVPGKKGSTGAANISAQLAHANSVILGYKRGSIWISNALSYIGVLNSEATPSAQAPPGFVQIAVAAGVASVKEARILQ
jgi:hypothetical protein